MLNNRSDTQGSRFSRDVEGQGMQIGVRETEYTEREGETYKERERERDRKTKRV